MTTINFSIKGNHETHKGSASIGFMTSGILAASEHFNFNLLMKRNAIGNQVIDGISYRIHECYVDSASEDYFYFAVENIN